jgi:hypothetical protein
MTVFLLVTPALAGYGAWAYFHPYRRCPRCKGTGLNRGSIAGRRWGKCGRCRGERSSRTIGARALHRAVRSAASWRSSR